MEISVEEGLKCFLIGNPEYLLTCFNISPHGNTTKVKVLSRACKYELFLKPYYRLPYTANVSTFSS